jgi:hypothetical protein
MGSRSNAEAMQKQCRTNWDTMYYSYMKAFQESSDAMVQKVNTQQKFMSEIGF